MSEQPMTTDHVPLPERLFESFLFSSRWLLAPFYFGLVVSLFVLLVKFGQEAAHLLSHVMTATGNGIIIGVLSLIDLSLIANLVLMVTFAGYESFVSRLHVGNQDTRLEWMGQIGFSELKLKLMASIVAISAIRVLEGFMTAGQLTDRELGWMVGIHLAFVVSGLMLAAMDRVAGRTGH